MPKHAILSASGSARWLACTPSARLELQYPDTRSEAAKEGTFAHAWAEIQLKKALHKETPDDLTREADMKEKDFYSKALTEYVNEYVDAVLEKYVDAQTRDKDAALLLEQSLDFSYWVPKGFGRGDAVIIADGLMEIVDLKYGKNVAVDAKNNSQLRLYALGAYHELTAFFDVDTVTMTVVQPRNEIGISSETLPVTELLSWGEIIRPIASLAYEGKGNLVPGPHCKFCKAAVRCQALKAYCETPDKEAMEMSNMEISQVLIKADHIISWLHKVQEYALEMARDGGVKWPGFKLVEGRSNRKYSDEEEVAQRLESEGIAKEKIYKPRALIGITDMQKLLGKKSFEQILSPYIIKPPGKPTLVPESDKRPEWNAPDDDFEPIPF